MKFLVELELVCSWYIPVSTIVASLTQLNLSLIFERPNAEVVGGVKDVTDARVKVVALRPIQKGDEILISYIEEPNRKERLFK